MNRIGFILVFVTALGWSGSACSQYSFSSFDSGKNESAISFSSFRNYTPKSKEVKAVMEENQANSSFTWLDLHLPPELKDSNEVHSPKKATIMSAIVPGLGQIYNEKYWKTGVIYVSAGLLGYLYRLNTDSMDSYQQALDVRIDGDPNTTDNKYPFFTDAKVTSERDYYRNNRDRIIIGMVALYALQIIDANVDAHLKEFEINEDLVLNVDPGWSYMPGTGLQSNLKLTLRF